MIVPRLFNREVWLRFKPASNIIGGKITKNITCGSNDTPEEISVFGNSYFNRSPRIIPVITAPKEDGRM
jgi:hypothetical protein